MQASSASLCYSICVIAPTSNHNNQDWLEGAATREKNPRSVAALQGKPSEEGEWGREADPDLQEDASEEDPFRALETGVYEALYDAMRWLYDAPYGKRKNALFPLEVKETGLENGFEFGPDAPARGEDVA